MRPVSKNTSRIVLVLTALVCSGILFSLFNDPEGSNLLVTVVAAGIIYAVSLLAYLSKASKKVLLGIGIQIALTVVLYFCLK